MKTKLFILVFQVIILVLSKWFDVNSDRRKKKAEKLKEIDAAFKDRDVSRVNALINELC